MKRAIFLLLYIYIYIYMIEVKAKIYFPLIYIQKKRLI
jgi:hypothetical protein